MENICGVVWSTKKGEEGTIDQNKTEKLRSNLRKKRIKKGIPTRDWVAKQRKRIKKYDLPEVALEIYKDVSSHSDKWMKEYKEFWGLGNKFTFDIPEIRDVNPIALRSKKSRVADDPLEF